MSQITDRARILSGKHLQRDIHSFYRFVPVFAALESWPFGLLDKRLTRCIWGGKEGQYKVRQPASIFSALRFNLLSTSSWKGCARRMQVSFTN